MATDTGQDNRQLVEYAETIAEAIHGIAHDLHRLAEIAERHAPLLDAYQRGGLIAMRTARKAANNGKRV
jgi:hypothetical protein